MFAFPALIMKALLLASVLTAQGPLDVEWFRPHAGPEVVVHRQAGPLVALRLSVDIDPSLPEGAVELLQELARPQAMEAAERLGARLTFRHEGGAAVMTVTGPVFAFDPLAAILRHAITEPDLSGATLRRAQARAQDRVMARLEQPEPRVRRLLRHALFGGPYPEGPAVARIEPEEVRVLRDRVYRLDRLRATVVGEVPDVVLRSAFSGWAVVAPGPDTGPALPEEYATEPARPQAHREWAGLGYAVDAEPAVMAVTAALIHGRIQRSALRWGAAELWNRASTGALVLIGSAEPDDEVIRATAGIGDLPVRGAGPDEEATGVGRYLRRTIAEAAALTGPDDVEEASARLRRELLIEARTVTGKAEVIGRLADGFGRPDAAAAFLAAIATVEAARVQALLREVLDTPAHYAEAR